MKASHFVTRGRLFGEFTMHRTCPECEFGVPVNGPTDRLACDRCGETVDVASLIDGALVELRDDPYDERRSGRRYTVGRDGKLTVSGFVQLREETPFCTECGSPLPLVDPGSDESRTCANCGAAWETFPPPKALRARHPYFLQCLNAERPGQEGKHKHGVSEGGTELLLDCPNCGATLEVGVEDPRHHGCAFCQSRFLIPDAAWEHLHPVRRKRRWFVELAPSPEHPAQGPLPRSVLETVPSKPLPMSEERREFLNQKAWLKRQTSKKSGDPKTADEAEDALAEVVPGPAVLARFRIVVRCMECGSEVPVNGPVQQVTCGTCFAQMPVGRFVGNWIREFECGSSALPRTIRTCRVGGRGLNGETHAQVVDTIDCPVCKEPLPSVAHGAIDGACDACGAAFTTFPGPAWLGDSVVSQVQCLMCEMEVAPPLSGSARSAFAGGSESANASVSAITFDCLGCGASLPMGPEAGRIYRCPYCSKNQYLPDEFWFRLHPPLVARDWFLALSGPLIRNPDLAVEAAKRQLSWNEDVPATVEGGSSSSPDAGIPAATNWRGHLFFALMLVLAVGAALLLLRLFM